jgi:serine/threonine protein kinase
VYLSETDSGTVAVRQFRSQFPPESAEGQADRHSFLAAARRAATLKQAQIAAVSDVIDEDGGAFLATEYLGGETLQSCLSRERFSAQQANILLRGIARALDYAHQEGVVHGDLKPSNVFVLPDHQIKVTDFAISPRARAMRQPFPAEWSHFYLSPEHLRTPEAIDRWSDQYSLGAIAYHLYTGQPPFAANADDLLSAISFGEVAPPSSVRPGLSQSADRAIQKALSREPQQRYASNALFVDRLEASIAFADPSQPSDKRSPKALYLAIGAAMVALLAIALFFIRPWRASIEPSRHSTSRTLSTELTRAPETKPAPVPRPTSSLQQAKTWGRPTHKKTEGTASPPAPTRMVAIGTPVLPPTDQPHAKEAMPVPLPLHVPEIAVFSRTTKIDPDSSFGYSDPTLGEMGYGDLKAIVQTDGPPPKGRLTLEWCLDDICQGPKPVSVNRPVDYNNEPTTGRYKIILRANSKPVKTFAFRITP